MSPTSASPTTTGTSSPWGARTPASSSGGCWGGHRPPAAAHPAPRSLGGTPIRAEAPPSFLFLCCFLFLLPLLALLGTKVGLSPPLFSRCTVRGTNKAWGQGPGSAWFLPPRKRPPTSRKRRRLPNRPEVLPTAPPFPVPDPFPEALRLWRNLPSPFRRSPRPGRVVPKLFRRGPSPRRVVPRLLRRCPNPFRASSERFRGLSGSARGRAELVPKPPEPFRRRPNGSCRCGGGGSGRR